mgnify:FL=1
MKLGPIQKKILLLLAGGLSLGLAYTPRQRYRTIRQIGEEWQKISNDSLRESINGLYRNKMIDLKEMPDGSQKMILLERGKKKTLSYKIDDLVIQKPKQWDWKWRMVLFDIPKDKKEIRDVLRFHLKRLRFFQYQKSVFIFPYQCKNEIDFLIEFYKIRPYVRTLTVADIDNERHLREVFKKIL